MEASVDTFVGDRTGIEWLLGSTVEYKKLESKKRRKNGRKKERGKRRREDERNGKQSVTGR